MCILPYIYGSYSLELGGDIELFCVVQDFCLVTVYQIPWRNPLNGLSEIVLMVEIEHSTLLMCHVGKCKDVLTVRLCNHQKILNFPPLIVLLTGQAQSEC